jgi:hypothetical protein
MTPGQINLGGNSDALKQQKHKTVATITAVKSSIERAPGKIDFGGNSDASKQQKRRHDTRHNDTKLNDTKHNDYRHFDTNHNSYKIKPNTQA